MENFNKREHEDPELKELAHEADKLFKEHREGQVSELHELYKIKTTIEEMLKYVEDGTLRPDMTLDEALHIMNEKYEKTFDAMEAEEGEEA